VTPAEEHTTPSDHARGHDGGGAAVSSSLAHLVAGSQGAITKRIDLALLEGQELLSRTLRRAALVALGLAMAVAAWFATAACLMLFVNPGASPVLRLATFALLNAGAALAFVALAMRRHHTPAGGSANELSAAEER
jgi:hypothetical protein